MVRMEEKLVFQEEGTVLSEFRNKTGAGTITANGTVKVKNK